MILTRIQRRAAERVRELRESRDLTQSALSEMMGIRNRQTLAAIEALERPITADEVVAAAAALAVELETLVDPFILVGEGEFNFRAQNVNSEDLDAFRWKVGRWVSTYRELERQEGTTPGWMNAQLGLNRRSTYEDAQRSAEWLWKAWDLGPCPASKLQDAIEKQLGGLVLQIDAPLGVSGAAVHLPDLQTIVVNRRETEGRRSYDLAHELFHVLTWQAMPPAPVEPWESSGTKGSRVEQLADNFASALLMPEPIIEEKWAGIGEIDRMAWHTKTAAELRVSQGALYWRLVNLRKIPKSRQPEFRGPDVAAQVTEKLTGVAPARFSRKFLLPVCAAIESGKLSERRAATLLDLSLDEFEDLLAEYDLSGPDTVMA